MWGMDWHGRGSPSQRQGTNCGLVPVSYTHLDVYKRQGKPDPNGAEPPEEKAGNGHKGA